ncbi:Helix-turn-helix domain-containing protein [Actinopolyspora xinjiangensis]|uniref:Helix-turn-helix domain-containing protein n=1 Tax=Actinopolyspora xinjiangensis TaxID=405564 RepID=A0A1H0Q1A2_9ACTN|nr:Helix-turn-helix domain-containing protein [Actinopolyspora xinjiangensis]
MRDVAERLGGHHSKYARLETGQTPQSPEMVVALLTTYGASESERDRLATMARDATDETNWIKPRTRSVNQDLTTLIEFERTATSIVDVSPIMIPGPLQTADYARAVMSSGTPSEELEAQVTMRVGRRDVLTRRNAPTLHSFIGEWALREPMGSAEIMADQLRHLAKMAELDNVTMRVIPSRTGGWTPAHAGHFLLFEFAKAAPVVHVEHLRSDAFLSSPGEIEVYQEATANLRGVAMSPEDSAELIASIATELEDSQE